MDSFNRRDFLGTALGLAGSLALVGCGGNGNFVPPTKSDTAAVAAWNEIATDTVQKFKESDPGGGLPPYVEARLYAMAFVAAHDVLNLIEYRFTRYTGDDPDDLAPYYITIGPTNASPDAAVAAAVRDVLVAQLPHMADYVNARYEQELASIPAGAAKARGISLGQQTAAIVNGMRQGDGSATPDGPYVPGNTPGAYRFTPPFDAPPFNGFAAAVNWPKVRPLLMTTAGQFLSPPPYRMDEAAYAADFNEVKALGGASSAVRTAEQSQIAKFWLENSPLAWNRIAMTVGRARSLNGWDLARLNALVQLAIADAYLASLHTKYTYTLWRPITAIRLADTDDNPGTTADPAWEPFDPVTPPVPEYNSAHSAAGGAAAAVLRGFFGSDEVSFSQTSTTFPGVTRTYTSFSQAADENGLSRIYVGYHFRLAVTEGRKQGEAIGKLTLTRLHPN